MLFAAWRNTNKSIDVNGGRHDMTLV